MLKAVTLQTGLFLCSLGLAALVSTPEPCPAATLAEPELALPPRAANSMTGSEFVRRTANLSAAERDAAALAELEGGNIPSFLRRLKSVTLATSTQTGKVTSATIWVTPDYLAIGSDEDFVYAPLNYYSATTVADSLGTVLPTPTMVDAIYQQSAHHLTPAPLPAGPLMRSNLYLSEHQQRIDTQRAAWPLGDLISGHKKDVVLSNRLGQMPGRIAIYGWHRGPEDPIQPLSTVHGARYVDYSHGIRLVSGTVLVDGQPHSIYEALQDPSMASLLSREGVTHDPWALMHPHPDMPAPQAGTVLTRVAGAPSARGHGAISFGAR